MVHGYVLYVLSSPWLSAVNVGQYHKLISLNVSLHPITEKPVLTDTFEFLALLG